MNQVYPEPTVGALILNNQNKILLVKSHKWINNKYSVPGGHVEIGESLSSAIIREVKEETGLDILPKRLFMIQECIKPDEFYKSKHFIFFDFICVSKNDTITLDKNELQEYVWSNIEDINEEQLESFTRNLIKKFRNDHDFNGTKIYHIK
tara:strand:- start:1154 stop:1603 length:450 start_codon:yes stop_codon:yes gene_type:complete